MLQQCHDHVDQILQPSSLRSYPADQWPARDPELYPQRARPVSDADVQRVRDAATSVPFDKASFQKQTKALGVPETVFNLLTCAKLNFAGVERVRAEPLWLHRIRLAVRKGDPVPIVYPLMCKIGGNGLKQLFNIRPTAGEDCTVFWFNHINGLVREYYPPGLRIQIVTDARLYNCAFGNNDVDVTAYVRGVEQAIQKHGGGSIQLHDYVDLLTDHHAQKYHQLVKQWMTLLRSNPTAVLGSTDADTLYASVQCSVDLSHLGLAYEDRRAIFGPSADPTNPYYEEVHALARVAFSKVIGIRKACAELNLFEQIYPSHVRVSCHKGLKDGRAVIGLRPYPEYYGSSKLLPYHGVPLITQNKNRLRLDIHPEVFLRARPDLTRITRDNGETYFYLSNALEDRGVDVCNLDPRPSMAGDSTARPVPPSLIA